jgi:hypothetical protein
MFAIQATIEYLKTQFSVKRRRDVAELYTRKYQDIIRDQFVARTHTPLESIPEHGGGSDDGDSDTGNTPDANLYSELSAYANSILA